MAKKQGGLGRDFYSLLDDNSILGDMSEQSNGTISVNAITPRKDQPRKDFDLQALQFLADSIREHGVLQPILVRQCEDSTIEQPHYEIIAGERRWRAARMASLSEIPAIIMTGDELKIAQISLIENVQRQDLNPVEEALAYRALIDKFDMTQEAVAVQAGKDRSTVTNLLRLLNLPSEVLAYLRDGKLTMGHARALLSLHTKEDMIRLAEKTMEKELSVREVERMVRAILNAEDAEPEEETSEQVQRRVYMKDLEHRAMTRLGRKVRILQGGKKKTVELTFEDDEDLEGLLRSICGEEIFS
jgi:ParB family chromosome partitioning protein